VEAAGACVPQPEIHDVDQLKLCLRAVGTGPADPAAAGPIIWQARLFMFTLYQFSTTWVDSSRIYVIRCQILMRKCTKFDFRWGSTPEPIAGFKAPTSKEREAKMEGRGRMESGGKKWGPYYYEMERRKWIGGREGKRKGFAGPMSKCFLRPCVWSKTGNISSRRSSMKRSGSGAHVSELAPGHPEDSLNTNFRCVWYLHRPTKPVVIIACFDIFHWNSAVCCN